jgi:hypothetical protein
MRRVLVRPSLPLAVVLLALPAALSAPVPKDFDTAAKKQERLFGKTVPSAKGGEFKFDATSLTAKMPAAKFGNESAPHVGMYTQTLVTGDFVAEVTMRTAPPNVLQPIKTVTLGGGLYAREPDKKTHAFASVAQNLMGRGPQGTKPGGWEREVLSLVNGNDDYVEDNVPVDPTAPYHLRLTRKGDTFATAISTNGEKWRDLKPMTVKLPATLGVGVFCYNRTGETADAIFEQFSVRPLK